jgi:hypothetical protein
MESGSSEEGGSSSSLTDTEAALRKALLENAQPSKSRSPVLIIMWGGICSGKTTASRLVLERLCVNAEALVDVNVDSLVYHIPGVGVVKSTSNESLSETAKAAYMKGRNAAKSLQTPIAHDAMDLGLDIYIEWTNEDNLHDLSNCKSELFDSGKLKAKGYVLVICLVECRDIEGMVKAAEVREKSDGRHIPECIIRKYNLDRALHFVTAVQNCTMPLRAFTLTRKRADSAGSGLIEITGESLAVSGEVDEEVARKTIDAVVSRIRCRQEGVFAKAANGLLLCLQDEVPPNSVCSLQQKSPADD